MKLIILPLIVLFLPFVAAFTPNFCPKGEPCLGLIVASSSFMSLISTVCWLFGYGFTITGIVKFFRTRPHQKVDNFFKKQGGQKDNPTSDKRRSSSFVYIVAGLALVITPFLIQTIGINIPIRDRLSEASGAFNNHEWATAYEKLMPLADKGDAIAQFAIGTMYEQGLGVNADDTEAAKYYRMGAEQGDIRSAASLAHLYEEGKGVKQNFAEAYFWYKAGDQDFAPVRRHLTEEQLNEINKRAAEWNQTHPRPTNTGAVMTF